MSKITVATLLVLAYLGSLGCVSHTDPRQTEGWKPIPELTDEFVGNTLDVTKWHNHNPTWNGRKPGFFSTNNVSVKDDQLHLTARAEDLPGLPPGYGDFTTAAVKSRARVLYGYFEVRCKPMKSRASSGFWFSHAQPEIWTEIDVFEIGGGAPHHEHSYHMNAHVIYTPEYKGTVEKHLTHYGEWKAPYLLASEYHVYAIEWNKNEIKWFADGQLLRTIKNVYWHQPLHMIFDSETMPNWLGLPKKENLPSTFTIDYIRSWKQVSPSQQGKRK